MLIKTITNNKNVLSLLGNLSVAVFGFLSFFILARSFSLDDMGEWVLFITAGNFLEMMRFKHEQQLFVFYPEQNQKNVNV